MTAPDPRMRAADTDRQATVDRLTDHFTAGRLTAAEYDERVRQAYAATYLDELPTLLIDLPDETRGTGAGFAGWGGNERSARWDDGDAGNGSDGDGADGWGGYAHPGRGAWYGPGPQWRSRSGGYRHRRPVALLPVILGVVLLIALTHGFILIPVFWIGMALLIFGRHRRGGCGHRIGPRSAP